MKRVHPIFKVTFVVLLLFATTYVLNTINKMGLLAYSGVSMLQANKKNFSLDKKLPTEPNYSDQPNIMGLWNVYLYDLRISSYHEAQLVGQLMLQDGTYQFEYFESIDEEIRNLLRHTFFIFNQPQGTFGCSPAIDEIAPKYLVEGRQVIADCSFLMGNGDKTRMFVQIETWQEKEVLALVEPVEPSRFFPIWKILKPLE